MTIESTISRAAEEVENGRLWRAKEILGSSFSTYGYSREILIAHAGILLRMGDDLEAGKFYLLSIDSPNEIENNAIEIFLSRFGNRNYKQLLATFPHCSRLESRDKYPEYLRRHLIDIGAPAILAAPKVHSEITPHTTNNRLFLIGCSLFAFCIVACILIGLIEIFSWFWQT